MLIPNPIASAAVRPHHPMVEGEVTLTWGEGLDRVRRLAAGLHHAGVGPGAEVGLPARPTVETVVALHALGWVGAVAVPLPPGQPRGGSTLDGGRLDDAALRLDLPPAPERPWPLEEPRVALHTSGTTGTPRRVTLSTGQLLLSAFASATRLGLSPADRWLACLPLHHVGGLQVLLRSAWYGTTVVLHPDFDPGRVAAALDSVTLVSLVPQMLARVLDARADRPFAPTLRAILLGGAPCPPELLARCRHVGAPVALSWGMTEAASQVATRFPGDLSDAPHSGPPLPFARVAAVAGRLVVDGPLVATPTTTTDVGWVDAGNVVVVGRSDDAILSGGEKILPEPIEETLCTHPAIADAAVVATHSARWGERPVAFVVPRGPLRGVLEWVRERLGPVPTPDRLIPVELIPRTPLGKPLRRLLRDQLYATEGVEEARRGGDGAEGPGVDDGVYEPRRSAQGAVGPHEPIAEGQGALTPLHQLQADREAVAHADGSLEVGLRVDERRGPLGRLEGRLEAPERRGPQLLVGDVAVLEDAPEEHDPRPVHLVEPGRQLDLPRHADLPEGCDAAR